ncbi:hydantoinase/oxoprolinase family protein [Falsiroseomonas selenitidurans]|uniref:Hydantoinase/oxoprolinase family protein n=1 Tax=Falsiroseomonas selenitidurans TaxID=2716335 RepID=A0ABX1E231_9PROT|nr:hydantoinase/oxoprolinase family protein [Falsiroseomonas selenitidurans]NKC31214.1 hydantoinase/oxoprolinase family protein [Falsiroseomonas selenitidurans]
MAPRSFRVGVDIGGTFADFCVLDEATGALSTLKVLSTPATPGREVIDGLQGAQQRFGIAPSEIAWFTHGTTVGVNAVIQRKGIRLALFVTRNFRDVLELARLKTPDPYDLLSRRPDPLVPRERVMEIEGRLNADGSEAAPLVEDSVVAALAAAEAAGAEGIVLALLHSYRNPAQEHQARAILQRLRPDMPVFCSADVWPIIREYERSITAVVHGHVQPRVAFYLASLQAALAGAGVAAEAMVTKSNGGVMRAELGKTRCVEMLLSGTAAGAIGAAFVAREAGVARAMSLDIGGTSADVAVIADGAPSYGTGERVGDFPVYIPTVAVTSIGEGGGSIAAVDALGRLTVGPESAGSTPGPACYGRGGTRATITDAMCVLGFIGHGALGYNAVQVRADLATQAVDGIAQALGRTRQQAAEAIVQVAVSGMYREVSKLAARQGVDPRDFCLMPFGGAGPMLGGLLARELGMREMLIPATPGVLSALGGLIADIRSDFIETVYADLDSATLPTLLAAFARLRVEAERWIRQDQRFTGAIAFRPSAEMRYRGQSFEIEVPLQESWIEAGDLAAMTEAFHQAHETLYGHADRGAPLQAIALRIVVAGTVPAPRLPEQARVAGTPEVLREVEIWLDGRAQRAPLYRRDALRHGHRFAGPCIVLQDDCTSCIPPGMAGEVDRMGNLRLTQEGARA